jgi:hypothetical protein
LIVAPCEEALDRECPGALQSQAIPGSFRSGHLVELCFCEGIGLFGLLGLFLGSASIYQLVVVALH